MIPSGPQVFTQGFSELSAGGGGGGVVVEKEQLTPPKRPCILKNQLCRMKADIEICLQFFLYVNIGHRDFSRTVFVYTFSKYTCANV